METTENSAPTEEELVARMLLPEEGEEPTEEVEDEIDSPEASEDMESEEDQPEDEDESEDDDAEIDSGEEDYDVDEDSEQDADDADQEAPQVFTVKVDGEELEVTLDDLKQGYSGQKFVQKGMQENAQMRKQIEELYSHLSAERQQVYNLYQQMQEGGIAAEPTPPSAELFDNDPIGYMEQKLKYDEAKAKYDQQKVQMEHVAQQQSQAQQEAMKAYAQAEMRQMLEAIPELGDANKATAVQRQLIDAGKKLGYEPDEITSVVDHRAITALYKAAKYDEIMAGKAKADKKTAKAKPMVRPGAKKVESTKSKKVQRQQRAKLKQSGSIDDAIALMFK